MRGIVDLHDAVCRAAERHWHIATRSDSMLIVAMDGTDPTPKSSSPRTKKRWSDFSPRQRVAIVLGAIIELTMTTIAVRDLVRRPRMQVRGSKPMWLIAFVVQPFGPILYFLIGRRGPIDERA
jgi:hypothetical protein